MGADRTHHSFCSEIPFSWEVSRQRSHVLSVRNGMGLLPRAAPGIRFFVSDSDRQPVKGKGQAGILAGVLDSPPTP